MISIKFLTQRKNMKGLCEIICNSGIIQEDHWQNYGIDNLTDYIIIVEEGSGYYYFDRFSQDILM